MSCGHNFSLLPTQILLQILNFHSHAPGSVFRCLLHPNQFPQTPSNTITHTQTPFSDPFHKAVSLIWFWPAKWAALFGALAVDGENMFLCQSLSVSPFSLSFIACNGRMHVKFCTVLYSATKKIVRLQNGVESNVAIHSLAATAWATKWSLSKKKSNGKKHGEKKYTKEPTF